jgi:hypothetical protein
MLVLKELLAQLVRRDQLAHKEFKGLQVQQVLKV